MFLKLPLVITKKLRFYQTEAINWTESLISITKRKAVCQEKLVGKYGNALLCLFTSLIPSAQKIFLAVSLSCPKGHVSNDIETVAKHKQGMTLEQNQMLISFLLETPTFAMTPCLTLTLNFIWKKA